MNIGEGSVIILLESILISARHLYMHRSHSTFEKHVWVLSRLITMKEDPESPDNRLLRYVVATCYPKMINRLNHRTWSQPYIDSLKRITTVEFDESRLERDRVSAKEIDNDRQFLLNFFLPISSSLQTKVPKLIKQAENAKSNKDLQLYTEDTCEEFHRLLIELLDAFRDSLNNLKKSRGDSKSSTKGSEEFKENVDFVALIGNALLRLSKGAALKMHMRTISSLLDRIQRMPVPEDLEDEQGELDEELEAVQPFVSVEGALKPLATSYIDWFKLMITNFDAVNILYRHFSGKERKYDTISSKIVVAPSVDGRLLPWQELFIDSKLFPTSTRCDNPSSHSANANADISNADILEFLEKALGASSKVKGIESTWIKGSLKNTNSSLKSLESSNVPGWSTLAKTLRDKVEKLKYSEPTERGGSRVIVVKEGPNDGVLLREITEGIRSLVDSATFVKSLTEGQIFLGTLHCEACLASLLSKSATVSEDILEQMDVSYVSNLFSSPVLFFMKGLWINYWSIKTLLPIVSPTAPLPRVRQRSDIRHKTLSQFCFSLYSAYMASRAYRKFDEWAFWGPIETGASKVYGQVGIIAETCPVHWFGKAFFR
jgi:hypothetical protein